MKKERVLALIQRMQATLVQGSGAMELFHELGEIGNRTEILSICDHLKSELPENLKAMMTLSVIQMIEERDYMLPD